MKHILLLALITTIGIMLVACSETNVNVNTNRMANTAGNAANTVANTAANVANTIANTVTSATTTGPESFMTDAAQGGMAEVDGGKLALQKAASPEVKKFAQMMITDHGAANTELKALAAKKNITLPADMGKHKSDVDDLSKLSGAEFDKKYVEWMVDDHETDVAAFEKQANSSSDADVKAFAAKTLPTLKKHLDAIKAIQAKMK